jgi:roadblock/LC7 domain-containing protein
VLDRVLRLQDAMAAGHEPTSKFGRALVAHGGDLEAALGAVLAETAAALKIQERVR